MKRRTDLSKLSDADYRDYKREYERKRQKKWRRKMRKLGIPVACNMSVNQRVEFRKAK